ncbi:dTDP-4-amino-4,6-dideoxygalactose transaminase [Metabacillus fastidiosus]|uniref:dTDP-4-amino-4,6-dideoxygalactose transaminase n=1 Tax=Metabacillus fastidiosus TaxID=1458 RepID=UPI002E1A50ED|nr:dTDP-4-amino-4,6-dideoxygalactose transaminase [Metabacillus fastidiosus]MED4454444.1 dTDP-4-amino-4,6-dideoxygalactose transaminase [Metabacillus fastidiosus]
MTIAFHKSFFSKELNGFLEKIFVSNNLSGDGVYTKKIHHFIEKNFKAKKTLLTTSCTSALELSMLLLDLKEGDEVILPSYTFVSSANPILLRKAKPVFVEINAQTLNMDPEDVRAKITSKTKAIIPVHYAGVACDMDNILKLAAFYKLKVIEDAAQGVNAKYKDKYLGTIGDLGCYSFHGTKNYSCGEGGSILINNNDDELFQRAEIIREKGTNRSQFIRGQVDKYTWVDIGSSFLPSDLLAAVLYKQFKYLDYIQNRRESIYYRYMSALKELEERELLRLPFIPEYCQSNYHIFHILLNGEQERNMLMAFLKSRGIQTAFHYIPLHTSPMGKKLGYNEGDFSITETISKCILRLPIYPDLTEDEQSYIIESIFCFFSEII